MRATAAGTGSCKMMLCMFAVVPVVSLVQCAVTSSTSTRVSISNAMATALAPMELATARLATMGRIAVAPWAVIVSPIVGMVGAVRPAPSTPAAAILATMEQRVVAPRVAMGETVMGMVGAVRPAPSTPARAKVDGEDPKDNQKALLAQQSFLHALVITLVALTDAMVESSQVRAYLNARRYVCKLALRRVRRLNMPRARAHHGAPLPLRASADCKHAPTIIIVIILTWTSTCAMSRHGSSGCQISVNA